jgi:hypothetical protein
MKIHPVYNAKISYNETIYKNNTELILRRGAFPGKRKRTAGKIATIRFQIYFMG